MVNRIISLRALQPSPWRVADQRRATFHQQISAASSHPPTCARGAGRHEPVTQQKVTGWFQRPGEFRTGSTHAPQVQRASALCVDIALKKLVLPP